MRCRAVDSHNQPVLGQQGSKPGTPQEHAGFPPIPQGPQPAPPAMTLSPQKLPHPLQAPPGPTNTGAGAPSSSRALGAPVQRSSAATEQAQPGRGDGAGAEEPQGRSQALQGSPVESGEASEPEAPIVHIEVEEFPPGDDDEEAGPPPTSVIGASADGLKVDGNAAAEEGVPAKEPDAALHSR